MFTFTQIRILCSPLKIVFTPVRYMSSTRFTHPCLGDTFLVPYTAIIIRYYIVVHYNVVYSYSG